ncbi:ABC transporter substrate-binding protein [Blastococcus sp. Marseille-P5729]|uniref:ABC transporter substrate-binding protein n=1 Tax=Blastococcus sp. Marseille-P5729 TaxID=2086582 RepID=UPI000D10C51B|nr:ABC transporter substrate-binding protein [Blastococcus sp. Marseille-P5729]
MLAALKTKIDADKMLTVPGSWASVNLDSDAILMLGQTYDVEMINGLAYLQKEGLIADGDTVGHIYVDSEFGQNGFLGATEYAKHHDINLIGAKISATDTDMTATITKLKADGVKAIALSVPPAATGSVAIQNQVQGLNVPLVGNNPAYAPTLLTDAAVEAGLENFYLVQSTAPVSTDIEKAKDLLEKYKGMSQDPPNIGTNMAYVWGLTYGQVLNTACEDGDMTRQGLLDARKKITSVTSDGLMGEQDLSDPGAPSTREAYILEADKAAEGGLSIVEDLHASDEAKEYKTPYQK